MCSGRCVCVSHAFFIFPMKFNNFNRNKISMLQTRLPHTCILYIGTDQQFTQCGQQIFLFEIILNNE